MKNDILLMEIGIINERRYFKNFENYLEKKSQKSKVKVKAFTLTRL